MASCDLDLTNFSKIFAHVASFSKVDSSLLKCKVMPISKGIQVCSYGRLRPLFKGQKQLLLTNLYFVIFALLHLQIVFTSSEIRPKWLIYYSTTHINKVALFKICPLAIGMERAKTKRGRMFPCIHAVDSCVIIAMLKLAYCKTMWFR